MSKVVYQFLIGVQFRPHRTPQRSVHPLVEKRLVDDLSRTLVSSWRANKVNGQRVWVPASVSVHPHLGYKRILVQHSYLDRVTT